ncbi:MAG: ABC transporter permease [Kiloniellales bacterium]|nr:ABC transporter permease [Kiloniellales bacterium]
MLGNALLIAVRELRRNVLRSILTIIGIVIGVAAVITMVTIGNGATVKVTADIEKLGSNLLIVAPGQRRGPNRASVDAETFDLADAEAIAQQIDAAEAVAPTASKSAVAIYGAENWSTTVTGTTNAYLAARNWSLAAGRDFTAGELRAGKAVCILGATLHQELFGAQRPLGEKIRLEKLSCQVIGLLQAKGQTAMGQDQDDLVLVPLRVFQRRIAGVPDVGSIQVAVRKGYDTRQAQREIEALMRERRRIGPLEDDDFFVLDLKEVANTVAGATRVLTALLGAVAAVSLLVGGVGIMNIMLVSVTERTREIGTRLAVGALQREVLVQFLIEAAVMSSFGGLLGIGLALAASFALADLFGLPFILDLWIVALAFAFSALVGVMFGYLPARRAAHLDPIEALRHE